MSKAEEDPVQSQQPKLALHGQELSVGVTASSHFAGVGEFGPVALMIHTNVSTSVVSSLCHSQTSPMLPSSLSANILASLCFSFSPQLHLRLEGFLFASCFPYSS